MRIVDFKYCQQLVWNFINVLGENEYDKSEQYDISDKITV